MADLLKTEKQKMLAGELYDALGPELTGERTHCEAMLLRYNTAAPEERDGILRSLVGSCSTLR